VISGPVIASPRDCFPRAEVLSGNCPGSVPRFTTLFIAPDKLFRIRKAATTVLLNLNVAPQRIIAECRIISRSRISDLNNFFAIAGGARCGTTLRSTTSYCLVTAHSADAV
jgi:hypothetical protein